MLVLWFTEIDRSNGDPGWTMTGKFLVDIFVIFRCFFVKYTSLFLLFNLCYYMFSLLGVSLFPNYFFFLKVLVLCQRSNTVDLWIDIVQDWDRYWHILFEFP